MRWQAACSTGILALLLGPCLVDASSSNPLPSVIFEAPLHFLSPEERAITIGPGTYAVEETGNRALQLVPLEGSPAFMLQAVSIHHDEQLSGPTAVLILTDEGTAHLVLLRPDGTALDSVGSLSGVRSRAPSLITPNVSPTPLTQGQIKQGLKAFGEAARIVGVPPAPVLTTPPIGHSVAAWGEQFSWQPGTGSPAPTSYQLCIAEAGKACARPGQVSTTSVVISNLPPTMRTYRITGPMLQPMLSYGQQKNLTWTIGACVPSQTIGPSGGPISGSAGQLTCQYARPRALTWKHVLKAPIPNSPEAPLVNDRPQLSIQSPVEGAHYYLFCVRDHISVSQLILSECEAAGRAMGGTQIGDGPYLGDHSFVVNSGTSLALSGWEWRFNTTSPTKDFPISLVGLPRHSDGGGYAWFVGACPVEPHPCSWSALSHFEMLPLPSLMILTREAPSRFRIQWHRESHPAVTHYQVCLATRGSPLRVTQEITYDIVRLAGMLRDLCSGDIPPGQQPAYQKPLPQGLAILCPTGGCRMPQPVQTLYVYGESYNIDLSEHPEWTQFGGQPYVIAVAACSNSNRNCLWPGNAHYEMEFPAGPRAPAPPTVTRTQSSATLGWDTWWSNTYYIPCVRETNATCETGNLLSQPRLDIPRVGTPQDHPRNCSLSGTPPTNLLRPLSGQKMVQVAGCNEAWGCRWSFPQTADFTPVTLPNRIAPPLMCRQP